MSKPGFFPTLPQNITDPKQFMREASIRIRQAMSGKINATAEIGLDTGTASTVLTDVRLHPGSVVLFDPMGADAAAELYSGALYVAEADRGQGEWTITHTTSSDSRTFSLIIIG